MSRAPDCTRCQAAKVDLGDGRGLACRFKCELFARPHASRKALDNKLRRRERSTNRIGLWAKVLP